MTYLVIHLISQDSVNNLLEQPLALPGFCFLLHKKFFLIIFMLTQEGSATLEGLVIKEVNDYHGIFAKEHFLHYTYI